MQESTAKNDQVYSDNGSFSAKLRQLRLGKTPHLSQERVARQLGVSRDTYANYESGRIAAPFWFACAIASYFGIPLEDLTKIEKERSNLDENIPSGDPPEDCG